MIKGWGFATRKNGGRVMITGKSEIDFNHFNKKNTSRSDLRIELRDEIQWLRESSALRGKKGVLAERGGRKSFQVAKGCGSPMQRQTLVSTETLCKEQIPRPKLGTKEKEY